MHLPEMTGSIYLEIKEYVKTCCNKIFTIVYNRASHHLAKA